jgi:hypothetical protein
MPVYELILSSDTINEGRIKINNAFSATTGLWSGGTGTQSLIVNNGSSTYASGDYSIAAGYSGGTNSDYSAVIAGYNQILSGSPYSFVGGGDLGIFTSIGYSISASTNSGIIAGSGLVISESDYSFMAGGTSSAISNSSAGSVIFGGSLNSIQNSSNASITSASGAKIVNSNGSFIAGGTFLGGSHLISNSAGGAVVGGSALKMTGASYSGIFVGDTNYIDEDGGVVYRSAIIGGSFNTMYNFGATINSSVIAGGVNNNISGNSAYSVILGGLDNYSKSSNYSVIFGGRGQESAGSDYAYLFGGGTKTPTDVAASNLTDFCVVMGGTNTSTPAVANNTIAFDLVNGDGYWDGTGDVGPADYAEYFEWDDENLSNEDRVGYFVSLVNGDKIVKGNSNIVGVVSATPALVGDAAPLKWKDTYERDEFGRRVKEKYELYSLEVEIIIGKGDEATTSTEEIRLYVDENNNIYEETPSPGNILGVLYNGDSSEKVYIKDVYKNKLNSLFDPNENYIPRKNRPEWSPIGLLGKLHVRTSEQITQPKISVDSNGMAVNGTDYHVLQEIKPYDGNYGIVQVLFK